jgi:hypothetical protein
VPNDPYPPCGLLCGPFVTGNGGNAQSRFDDRGCGDGKGLIKGFVEVRGGLPRGECRPSLGVIGETLREGDALTGVNWSWGKNGRSGEKVRIDCKMNCTMSNRQLTSCRCIYPRRDGSPRLQKAWSIRRNLFVWHSIKIPIRIWWRCHCGRLVTVSQWQSYVLLLAFTSSAAYMFSHLGDLDVLCAHRTFYRW